MTRTMYFVWQDSYDGDDLFVQAENPKEAVRLAKEYYSLENEVIDWKVAVVPTITDQSVSKAISWDDLKNIHQA